MCVLIFQDPQSSEIWSPSGLTLGWSWNLIKPVFVSHSPFLNCKFTLNENKEKRKQSKVPRMMKEKFYRRYEGENGYRHPEGSRVTLNQPV